MDHVVHSSETDTNEPFLVIIFVIIIIILMMMYSYNMLYVLLTTISVEMKNTYTQMHGYY